ncbi:prepilin-type N-terminal cleavage/methylation domain-containing protein [Beduini massiliensis]|uniref:prepilin-type N-terminal cleavage/methylation domain-containing protein n=1 Tax=Beduini massiliensis TaxID=1585974 RepID=UPI00059A8766|nr:prepilin-type N-terminal cleavage/methylation domain-containing protein [Beduini massiliensis]
MSLINFYKNKDGFSLIELIVVIAIIVILAAAVAPNLSWFVKDAKEEELIAQGKVVLISTETKIADLRKTATDTGQSLQDLVNLKKDEILKDAELIGQVDPETFFIEVKNRQLYYFEFVLEGQYVCYNDGEVYVNKTSQSGNSGNLLSAYQFLVYKGTNLF